MSETTDETTEVTEVAEAPEAPEAPETTEAPEAVEVTEVTEAPEVTEQPARREPVIIDRPIQTVGRRKEAVVRVRLVPGTGKFQLDGRTLEAYFPNKVHQQLIKAPLVTVDRVDSLRHLRPPRRRRPLGPGRCASPRDRPRPDPGAAGGPAGPEEGRLPHPRPACHRAQEVRPEEGPQGAAVQQALTRRIDSPGVFQSLRLDAPGEFFCAPIGVCDEVGRH